MGYVIRVMPGEVDAVALLQVADFRNLNESYSRTLIPVTDATFQAALYGVLHDVTR